MARKKRGKETKKATYIFCEGETEEQYFKLLKRKYRSSLVKIDVKVPGNTDPVGIVESVRKHFRVNENDAERIYVVFDYDGHTREEIEKAVALAKKRNITVLYSNHCFEVFLLSHFQKINTNHTAKMLYNKLERELGISSYEDFKGKELNMLVDLVNRAESNCTHFSKDVHTCLTTNPYTNIPHYLKEIFQVENL